MISRLSTETCTTIQQGYKEKGVRRWRTVLRKVVRNTRDINVGKFALIWEGPYKITTIVGAGVYYLEDMDERPLSWPWNAHNLKKFYH